WDEETHERPSPAREPARDALLDDVEAAVVEQLPNLGPREKTVVAHMADLLERPVLGHDVALIVAPEQEAQAMPRADMRNADEQMSGRTEHSMDLRQAEKRIEPQVLEDFGERREVRAPGCQRERLRLDVASARIDPDRTPEAPGAIG